MTRRGDRARKAGMGDPEVERAAEFLATHALLLLGIGIVAVVVSFVAIVIAVRIVGRRGMSVNVRSLTKAALVPTK